MINRRDAIRLAGRAGGAALAASAIPATAAERGDTAARRLLDEIAEEGLAAEPEQASQRGLDKGHRAPLRSRLMSYSAKGRAETRARLERRLRDLDRVLAGTLSPEWRKHAQITRETYRSALGGLAFPYGRVSVGGWLQTPYVVSQNTGAYIDVPRLLDADHPLDTSADADAYLARLRGFATALDDETARLRDATGAA